MIRPPSRPAQPVCYVALSFNREGAIGQYVDARRAMVEGFQAEVVDPSLLPADMRPTSRHPSYLEHNFFLLRGRNVPTEEEATSRFNALVRTYPAITTLQARTATWVTPGFNITLPWDEQFFGNSRAGAGINRSCGTDKGRVPRC